jgi:hypothetical protein
MTSRFLNIFFFRWFFFLYIVFHARAATRKHQAIFTIDLIVDQLLLVQYQYVEYSQIVITESKIAKHQTTWRNVVPVILGNYGMHTSSCRVLSSNVASV